MKIIYQDRLKSGLEFLTDRLSDLIFVAIYKYIQTLTLLNLAQY